MTAPEPMRETYRVSSRPKGKLNKAQERRRIEGLRALARIIACHYLANPHMYRNGAARKKTRKEGEA